ncbi:Hydrophob seed domain-containing protein [Citrus sinensis]|nr:Hydrophob seed domain-containing protein [Citrus sinensis]
MGKYQLASSFILLLNLGTLVTSLACDCSNNPPPPPPASKTSNCPPPPSSQVPKTPPPPPPFVKSPPPPVPPPTPIVNPPPPNGPPPPCVTYPPPPPKQQTCPIDALKLGACVDVLGGLIHIGLSDSAKEKCCPLLQGLADLDAAICLCTAIRLEALNLINLLVPISLQVLVNDCRKYPPAGFQCPA